MKIHFMGIGGAGTSSAAALAKEAGFEVSGCDADKGSVYLDELKRIGVSLEFEHDPAHLVEPNLLVVSSAINKSDSQNPETLEARKRGLKILPTEKFLSDHLVKDKFLIAVAGTHGKSTTTAMVGQILEDSGLDPTVYVGTLVTKWGRNYRFGRGKYFVIEADEYEEKFLNYQPNVGVITNIEFDHPDYYKNEDEIVIAFGKFVSRFKEDSKLILGTEASESRNIEELLKLVSNIVAVENFHEQLSLNLRVPGEHNLANARAAFLVGNLLNIDSEQIKKSLESFSGTARRFEFKDEINNIKIFDDYAHHPSEVMATIDAAREKFPKERIWLVFQPHTYSRTIALFDSFVKSFEEAKVDNLILVDIYAAREKDEKKINSLDLAKAVRTKKVVYIGLIEEAGAYLAKNVASGDIVINMGAGDIYKLSEILINKLEGQNARSI